MPLLGGSGMDWYDVVVLLLIIQVVRFRAQGGRIVRRPYAASWPPEISMKWKMGGDTT